MNPRGIVERVERLLAEAQPDPYLVGYDVNEIQAFVTANGRPLGMRGASETIAGFDAQEEPRAIFAGGGRGISVVNSSAAAAARCSEWTRRFGAETHGATIAVDFVKLDRSAPHHSLRWLRQRLEVAKDAAPKPTVSLPSLKEEQCDNCRTNKATEEPNGGRDELICPRCKTMVARGRQNPAMAQSLNDLSRSGHIAAVSADGNNFGELFDGLRSLTELAVVSSAVRQVFRHAREAAGARLPPRKLPDGRTVEPVVSVAVGGDDIRAFVAEDRAIDYVHALVSEAIDGSHKVSDALAGVNAVSAETRRRLGGLGIGIGLIASDSHFPAYRLMEYAHEMERSAKRLCSKDPQSKSPPARFALDFLVLRSGEELLQGLDGQPRTHGDIRPIELNGKMDAPVWQQARALAGVPTSQRAIFAEAARADRVDAETANLLRYQVARNREWQAYYKACGAEWTQPAHVESFRPHTSLFDLVRLMAGDT